MAKTLQSTTNEVMEISRKLRGFARKHVGEVGTESSMNLASKTMDDLPAKAASAAIYDRQLEKAAAFLKHAVNWDHAAFGKGFLLSGGNPLYGALNAYRVGRQNNLATTGGTTPPPDAGVAKPAAPPARIGTAGTDAAISRATDSGLP